MFTYVFIFWDVIGMSVRLPDFWLSLCLYMFAVYLHIYGDRYFLDSTLRI
ncbi:hypothetical protein Sjap_006356 [Stephania japonica]|uniref:Uncharacterized protein n=1 Tax=Stephania japonica TaxID=461633 RepID=A0AAP0PIU1_9MAGN